jgi:hypothetical protein
MASDLGTRLSSPEGLMGFLREHAEAGNALVTAGLVEDWLEKLLLAAGRSLEDGDVDRIFGRMGPLNNFASKIEIAYMFDLIDKSTRDDLRRIKNIRNAFAHTTRYVFFETRQIADQCQKLSNWKPGMRAEDCYREKAIECVNAINAQMNRLMFAKALREEPIVKIDDSDD